MSTKTESTHESPGGQKECPKDDGVVNDSLGTIDPADSTGTGDGDNNDDKSKGAAKSHGGE